MKLFLKVKKIVKVLIKKLKLFKLKIIKFKAVKKKVLFKKKQINTYRPMRIANNVPYSNGFP